MKKNLEIIPVDCREAEIGRWLGALEDCRRRTKRVIDGIRQDQLDWTDGGNSIGTLLYHIAAIELDWVYTDVLGEQPFPEELVDLYPVDVRDEAGILNRVAGEDISIHSSRMDKTREHVLRAYRTMTIDDYRRSHSMDGYDVTPEWVLHHLMQHEAEHRGQIELLLGKMESKQD
jgi:uncharacterized damage-inducible protein DinB